VIGVSERSQQPCILKDEGYKRSPEPIRIVPGLGEWLIGNEPCAIVTTANIQKVSSSLVNAQIFACWCIWNKGAESYPFLRFYTQLIRKLSPVYAVEQARWLRCPWFRCNISR